MTKKEVLRAVVFLLLCFGVFVYLNNVFTISDSSDSGKMMNSFHSEKKDSLDGCYLGSSAVYRFWNPVRAYNKEGISVFTFASSDQPMVLCPYVIEEIEKTQDPKVYIIELRDLIKSADQIEDAAVRRFTDNLSMFSLTRLKAINASIEFARKGDNNVDKGRMDHYLPIVKYHTRWDSDDLNTDDLLVKNSESPTKGFVVGEQSMTCVPRQQPDYTEETVSLEPEMEELLGDLMKFCDGLDAQVLYVLSPYYEDDPKDLRRLNEIERLVEESGHKILNFNSKEMTEKIGLNWKKDLYDKKHVNIIGSEKYTDYLAQYLKEAYNLPDHRGDADYKSWEESYEYYLDYTREARELLVQENKK